ncbi:MAG: hypothetical protein ABIP64_13600 [Burkholderiales bacterium]
MNKPTTSPPPNRWRVSLIVGLIVAFTFALLLDTGLETYLNQERRWVSAGHEIVTALEAYRVGRLGERIALRVG